MKSPSPCLNSPVWLQWVSLSMVIVTMYIFVLFALRSAQEMTRGVTWRRRRVTPGVGVTVESPGAVNGTRPSKGALMLILAALSGALYSLMLGLLPFLRVGACSIVFHVFSALWWAGVVLHSVVSTSLVIEFLSVCIARQVISTSTSIGVLITYCAMLAPLSIASGCARLVYNMDPMPEVLLFDLSSMMLSATVLLATSTLLLRNLTTVVESVTTLESARMAQKRRALLVSMVGALRRMTRFVAVLITVCFALTVAYEVVLDDLPFQIPVFAMACFHICLLSQAHHFQGPVADQGADDMMFARDASTGLKPWRRRGRGEGWSVWSKSHNRLATIIEMSRESGTTIASMHRSLSRTSMASTAQLRGTHKVHGESRKGGIEDVPPPASPMSVSVRGLVHDAGVAPQQHGRGAAAERSVRLPPVQPQYSTQLSSQSSASASSASPCSSTGSSPELDAPEEVIVVGPVASGSTLTLPAASPLERPRKPIHVVRDDDARVDGRLLGRSPSADSVAVPLVAEDGGGRGDSFETGTGMPAAPASQLVGGIGQTGKAPMLALLEGGARPSGSSSGEAGSSSAVSGEDMGDSDQAFLRSTTADSVEVLEIGASAERGGGLSDPEVRLPLSADHDGDDTQGVLSDSGADSTAMPDTFKDGEGRTDLTRGTHASVDTEIGYQAESDAVIGPS